MTWQHRTVDGCEWRDDMGQGDGRAVCRLLQDISGRNDPHLLEVSREACEACCREFPPSVADPNPVLASLLFQMAERMRTGGNGDADLANWLGQRALELIPLTLPDEEDAILRAEIAATNRASWPPLEETLPKPAVQSSQRVGTWAVGVTTSPRRLPTLEFCLDSLARAGWPDVRLFVDNNGPTPPKHSSLPTTRRDGRVGAWPNFHLALLELYQRHPRADAFMMVQDDVVFYEHPGLRAYLEESLWPGGEPCLLSLFCSQLYAQREPGWTRFDGSWVWGAQAFVFSRPALEIFLSSREVIEHRTNPHNGFALIDQLVGKWAHRQGVPVYFPTPSLTQHIGHVSTLWPRARVVGGRRAAPFAGDWMDRKGLLDRQGPGHDGRAAKPPATNPKAAATSRTPETTIVDCLQRASIVLPHHPLQAEKCVVTIASDGFEHWLDDMLGSLIANGKCQDALIAVVILEGSEACQRVAAKYGARVILCRGLSPTNSTFKSVLYSIARVIDAQRFVCIDADMIVLEEIDSLFSSLAALPPKSILACREGNGILHPDLEGAFEMLYHGRRGELQGVLGASERERRYPLVVNDGLFAGRREALLALDAGIRELSSALTWIDERADVRWRNQFIFNLMLARLDCGVELDPRFNVQPWYQDIEWKQYAGRPRATWNSRPVHVLHFCGLGRTANGRDKYAHARGRFARVRDPLHGRGGGDMYGEFIGALRSWIGRRGLSALRWSFYGTPDGMTAAVRDPDVFPVLAFLHYLIRSSGCRSVLECGAGLGISTACLASAVAHRQDGRVVTVDCAQSDERDEFWAELPPVIRERIDFRRADSLAAMDALLAKGACFDAALLDSQHTCEHVLCEFDRAKRLVRPGGLILIHDFLLASGTVEDALRVIESSGYNVTRLWATEGVQAEDNELGLAVIVNRLRVD